MKTLLHIGIICLFALSATAQDWAKAKLDKSPRHHEWVKVKNGSREVDCFLAFPEVSSKATAVVVIHENKGLTDWVRTVADELAVRGFIAIAPDLLSGTGPNGGNTTSFANPDAATRAIGSLPPVQVTADLNAVAAYLTKLPAANGKFAVAGFCWGGAQTFRFVTNNKDAKAGFVFYGTGPDSPDAIEKISVPVYGFYGGNDARVNATIPKSKELMEKAGKKFEPVTYEGAGHGFMRAGEEPNPQAANKKARDEAWTRLEKLLKAL